jgi:hypothetical protein
VLAAWNHLVVVNDGDVMASLQGGSTIEPLLEIIVIGYREVFVRPTTVSYAAMAGIRSRQNPNTPLSHLVTGITNSE